MDDITSVPPVTTPQPIVIDESRHFLAVFFISFMWGSFGIDRFYLGKVWTGILKLITFGGFGLWVIIDLVLIMSGAMRDKQGNPMREAARYKKFAAKTVLLFALGVGLIVLVSGASLIYAAYTIVTQLMDGGTGTGLLPFTIPGVTDGAGLDQLQQVQDLQNVDTTNISL